MSSEIEIHEKWNEVRGTRTSLLEESDHLILIAYEQGVAPSAELLAYRQQLRDIPNTFDNPWDVEYPTLSY